jgi:hypothetical protein
VSASKHAPGVERVYAPGELAFTTRQQSAGTCRLSPETARSLIEAAAKVGVVLDEMLSLQKENAP